MDHPNSLPAHISPAASVPTNASAITEHPAIVWFRDDLRMADNPALSAAAQGKRPVIALYVLDEENRYVRPVGGASPWQAACAACRQGGRCPARDYTRDRREHPGQRSNESLYFEPQTEELE